MNWVIGILLNGVICFFLGAYLTTIKTLWLKIVCFFTVPYVIAYGLYWALAFMEGISDQHSSWVGVIVPPWSVAGYLTMAIGLGLFTFIKSKHKQS